MASGKKQGMHPTSKSYADNLGKLAGKSIAQGAHQYSNLSAKMLIGQSSGTTGHSKKLSKAEISNVNSKFLAGVKGTQGGTNAATNMAGMMQTIKNSHAGLYGNQGSKSGDSNAPRKLIKSTSHVQIGQSGIINNGQNESVKASAVGGGQISNSGNSMGGFKDMQTLHNPTALKTMHKNMSVAQLNQPHLQGSFLNSLQ